MSKIIKTVTAIALSSALLQAPFSFAAFPDENSVVSKNFKQVGRALRGMRSAKTAEDMVDILGKVKTFSVKNRDLIPSILDKDSPMMADYKKGMDDFIAKVDEALQLAEAGDFAATQKAVKGFRDIKMGAHDHFNVEWKK